MSPNEKPFKPKPIDTKADPGMELDRALLEWSNKDRLFVLDEKMSLIATVAPIVWIVATVAMNIPTWPIIVPYAGFLSSIWIGYKIARIRLSIRLRIFIISTAIQGMGIVPLVLICLLVPIIPMILILARFALPNEVIRAIVIITTFFMTIVAMFLIHMINYRYDYPGRWMRNRWDSLSRKDYELMKGLQRKTGPLEDIREVLRESALSFQKSSHLIGMYLTLVLGALWLHSTTNPLLVISLVILVSGIVMPLILYREKRWGKTKDLVNKLHEKTQNLL